MNCEQSREIILTDYIDGRLAGPVKVQFEAHLATCRPCQAFLSAASETLCAPFSDLAREKMPESVASAIMQRVRSEEYQRGHTWVQRLLEGIRDWYAPFLPATGWAMTILICCIIVGVGFRVNGSEQAKQTERILFLAEVADFSSVKNKVAGEYGTSMETYFLENKEAS